MPIRFRCAYCNQLMGIARRKAGQVVHCPTCSGQVVVPNPEEEEAQVPVPAEAQTMESSASGQKPNLLENDDFDKIFEESPSAPPPQPAQAPIPKPAPMPEPSHTAASSPHPVPQYDVEQVDPNALVPMNPEGQAGIFLSPARATILTIVGIILLAVAFGAGVLVGRIL